MNNGKEWQTCKLPLSNEENIVPSMNNIHTDEEFQKEVKQKPYHLEHPKSENSHLSQEGDWKWNEDSWEIILNIRMIVIRSTLRLIHNCNGKWKDQR